MSESKGEILAAIRRQQGRGPLDQVWVSAIEARIGAGEPNIIPKRAQGDSAHQVALFRNMAEQASATVDELARAEEIPDALAAYLTANNLPAEIIAAPHPVLEGLPWSARPTHEPRFGTTDGSDTVALSHGFAAVAETGTLVLRSGPDSPTLLNFLPDTHIVAVPRSAVTGDYETVWRRLRETGATPRTVNLVTGPSRTADIEQTLQMGAHGPRRLHILIYDDAPASGAATDR